MPYSTNAEVQADFKQMEFTTESNVTATDVDQFILESDALINAYVGQRYVVPVTAGTSALALLKLFSRSLTACRVKAILEAKQQTSKGADQNVRTDLLSYRDVIKELEKLRDGEIALDGATPLVVGGGFYNNNVANCVQPVIRKDEKQW